MHELQGSWDRTVAHLRAARDLLSPDVATLGDVDDYLSHNELGLALDVLVAAGEAAPVAFWSSLRAAVAEMDLGPDDPVHGASVREVFRN